MNMKWTIGIVAAAIAGFGLTGIEPQEGAKGADAGSPKRKDKVVLTEAQWKKKLTPEQYRILRAQGTEAAFCGIFHDNHQTGVYSCVGCDLPVFKSDAKFDSGTGWPSFFQPYAKDSVWTRRDASHGMVRDEVLCARCDGHLGHVFNDGPKPSGLRFCINSEVLKFKKTK
jgi:methionine-R-sulfoxide reductase